MGWKKQISGSPIEQFFAFILQQTKKTSYFPFCWFSAECCRPDTTFHGLDVACRLDSVQNC